MIGRLSLAHLRLLVTLHEYRSVTAAAAALGLTQSAASHQIREMERRLGVPLFQRKKNRLFFTPLGERALASARVIVEEALDLEQSIERALFRVESTLTIGLRGHGCHWWLARFLAERCEALAAHTVEIDSDVGRPPLDALRYGDVDLAITPSSYIRRQFRAVTLFEDELVAVLPPGHPLAGEPFLTARHFAGAPYVTYSPMHEAGLEYDRLMKPAGVMPGRFLIAGSALACLDCVREGLGLACLPRSTVTGSVRRGALAIRPLTAEGLAITWRALTRDGQGEDGAPLVLARLLADWCAANPALLSPASPVTPVPSDARRDVSLPSSEAVAR